MTRGERFVAMLATVYYGFEETGMAKQMVD